MANTTYKYRIGTKRLTQVEGELANQTILMSAYQKNNQAYCLCRYPNPLLTIRKRQNEFSLEAIKSASLVPHHKECLFYYENHQQAWKYSGNYLDVTTEKLGQEWNGDWPSHLLWVLWVQTQLNVWSPKMQRKRKYKNIVAQIKRVSRTIRLDHQKLADILEVAEPKHRIKSKPIVIGIVKNIEGNKVALKYTNEEIFIPHAKAKQLKATEGKHQQVICVVRDANNPYTLGTLAVNKSFLPIGRNDEGTQIRFFVEGGNNLTKAKL